MADSSQRSSPGGGDGLGGGEGGKGGGGVGGGYAKLDSSRTVSSTVGVIMLLPSIFGRQENSSSSRSNSDHQTQTEDVLALQGPSSDECTWAA